MPIHFVAVGGSVGTLGAFMLAIPESARYNYANVAAHNLDRPAHLAATNKRSDMLAALKDYGADMTRKGSDNMTPLQLVDAAKHRRQQRGQHVVQLATPGSMGDAILDFFNSPGCVEEMTRGGGVSFQYHAPGLQGQQTVKDSDPV